MSETRTLELLRAIGDQFAGLAGAALFQQVVYAAAQALAAHSAFASKFDAANGTATLLASWPGVAFETFAQGRLEGSPGALAGQGQVAVYRDALAGHFPQHRAWLEQQGFRSYLAVPLHSGDGGVAGQLAVLDRVDRDWNDADIDVLRLFALRAAAALEHAARLEQALHARDALRNMGHDLRTPLNGMLGYAQLLLRDPAISPAQRDGLEAIRSSGARLLRHIDELKDIANIDGLRWPLDAPARRDYPPPTADGPGVPAASPAGVATGYTGKRLRLLIADDDQQSCDLLAKALAPLGFECTPTSDGADAIAALQCAQFDLILTDLNMPRVDGFGVLQAARAQQPQRPVLAVSANTAHDSRRRAIAAGFTDFIAKPWALDQLLQSVGSSLGINWVYRAAPVAHTAQAQRAAPGHRDLDPALLASLHHFAKAGDVNALLDTLDRACGPAGNHPLADELRRLTRQYDLKSVRKILEPLTGPTSGAAAGREG